MKSNSQSYTLNSTVLQPFKDFPTDNAGCLPFQISVSFWMDLGQCIHKRQLVQNQA